MKRLQRENRDHGVSEVIGALMLILIVVIAASALAVFISEKQKDIQEQDRLETRRSLEKVQTTWITPTKTTGSLWENIEVELTSLHVEESDVTRLVINGAGVANAVQYNTTSGSFDIPVSLNNPLRLESLETILLNISLLDANFYSSKPDIDDSDYIKVDIHTKLLNTFSRIFQPPTSIIMVATESQWDPSIPGYTDVIILDGSGSDHPNEDTSIITWEWQVEGDDDDDGVFGESGEENFTLKGRKVRTDTAFTSPAGSNHTIVLTVFDSYGMRANSTLIFNY
jgi:flagellin-like protein